VNSHSIFGLAIDDGTSEAAGVVVSAFEWLIFKKVRDPF